MSKLLTARQIRRAQQRAEAERLKAAGHRVIDLGTPARPRKISTHEDLEFLLIDLNEMAGYPITGAESNERN